jgi:hypothetical protein
MSVIREGGGVNLKRSENCWLEMMRIGYRARTMC